MLHLGFNMCALYFIGIALEPAMGRSRFLARYAVSLIGGALGGHVAVGPERGVHRRCVGGDLRPVRSARRCCSGRGINPLRSSIGTILLINLVFTFVVAGISKGGHIGGLLAGAIVGAPSSSGVTCIHNRRHERSARFGVVVAIGVVLFWASMAGRPSFAELLGG